MSSVTFDLPFVGFFQSPLSYEIESAIEGLENPEINVDFYEVHVALAKDYVRVFFEQPEFGNLDHQLEFSKLWAPREYNFVTDRIFVKTSLECFHRIFKEAKPCLQKAVNERHKSRDGYISFYTTDLKRWFGKPLEDYDHNEAGTVFLAWLYSRGIDIERLMQNTETTLIENGNISMHIRANIQEAV